MMSDDVVEILKAIQAQFGGMDIMIRDMSHQITGLEVGQQRLNDQITVLQQDVRDIRTAINDMERTRFTSGEAEALHKDVSRLQQDYYGLTVRLGKMEARR